MENVRGLSEKEVIESQKTYGENKLTKKERPTFWKKYSEKFDDPIIVILLIALGINIVFTFFGRVDWFECFGIFLSVMIATLVGAMSEYKNEEVFQKIQEEAEKRLCKVYRSGRLLKVESERLVVGDLVLLQSGDMVPADGYVFDGEVMVDQASLNGENKEVKKTKSKDKTVSFDKEVDFWDEIRLFCGSIICSGQCIMEIKTVGDKTVYGRLNHEAQAPGGKSPLQLKLGGLAKKISIFGYFGAAVVTILCMLERIMGVTSGNPLQVMAYFKDYMGVFSDFVSSIIVGITVIVVAVPVGLPLMIAIVCSLNMKKMMKSNVLVRKLIGIETAGSINILFSDKTGTITKGKLSAISFKTGDKKYERFEELEEPIKKLLYISSYYNSAAKYSGNEILGGNATEKALLEFVKPYKKRNIKIEKIKESLFSSDKKFSMAWVKGDFDGVLIKGAPEKILENCSFYYDKDGKRQRLENAQDLYQYEKEMAARSERILAIATAKEYKDDKLPKDLTLLGLMGIKDDLRTGVLASVNDMKKAGIQTVMITGDKKETAISIAKESGIIEKDSDLVLTSKDLAKMTDKELGDALTRLRVVARAIPEDKSRLVKIAKERGMVSAMTGDGVNDLAALRTADVGFAMGSGTDVAKEAGDIVILDDNFSSIKKAVLYGRTIYKSIKKFITFQMTINIAAVTVSVLGPLVGIDKPLGITQMLWINLVMDTLAAIAFGGEAALSRYMLEKPRNRNEDIIDKKMWSAIMVGALFISAMSLFMFISQDLYYSFRQAQDDAIFYTGYFSYFVFSCIFNAFNARTDEVDLTKNISLNKPFLFIILLICAVQIFMTYFGGKVLGTAGLSIKEWVTVILMALLIIPVDIFRKIVIKKI